MPLCFLGDASLNRAFDPDARQVVSARIVSLGEQPPCLFEAQTSEILKITAEHGEAK